MRKIALLLAACLLLSTLPVMADEIETAPVDEAVVETEGELASTEAVEPPETEGWEPPIEETGETPSDGLEPAPEEGEDEPSPKAPSLSADEVTLGEGEVFALAAIPPEGAESPVTWTSDDPDVAEVDETGIITAVAPGDTFVRARVDDGPEAACAVHVRLAPDAVRFSEDAITFGRGEKKKDLRIILGSGDGEYAGAFTVTSDDESVAKRYDTGNVKGLGVGTATLTVTTYNGLTASCAVTVMRAPKAIEIEIDKALLGVGETAEARFALPEKTAGQVHFESSDPAVATVDAQTGAVCAVAVGEAQISAVAFNGRSASVAVTVQKAPKRVTLKPAAKTLGVGMTKALTAKLPSGAAGAVTFSSADASVASVDEAGVVTAVAPGQTVVRAEAYNGAFAECAVEVRPAPEAVTLPYARLTIGVGEYVKLEPDVGDACSTYTYTSSDRTCVRAYASGRIRGMAVGTAYVKVRTYNGKSVRVKVIVRSAPESVKLSCRVVGLAVGETRKLTAKLPSGTGGTVTFSSKDPSVASVDARTGQVTALAAGTTFVYARAYNGVQARCVIKVYPMPEWIVPSTTMLKLGMGQQGRLTAEITPGSRSPITFTSRDESIATVDADGLVTSVSPGTTKVYIDTNAPGVRARVFVKVMPAPDSVRLRKKKLTLNVCDNYTLKPVIPTGTWTTFTYATDDPLVATVSDTGEIFAAGRGTTTITVSTHNGLTASLDLTVYDPTYPESVTLTNIPTELTIGDTWQMTYACVPETADPELVWSSNDEEIIVVSEDGELTALTSGYVYVYAQSARNPDIQLSFKLSVAMEGQTLVIPARQTDIPGIPKNLELIEAIRRVAIAEVNKLYDAGKISGSDAWKRRDMINNIFEDYAFPWMTPEYQLYWKKENSEGGVKDYKPGIVYYGMPYISGGGNNRRYNRAKALRESRYTDSGDGYYLLNRDNLLNGKYVGNDCSGLVDQAIWGTESSHSGDRTADIAVISAYKTIADYTAMRPGDLLCKGNAHVFMFLYYTNPEHTKFMFIENGGTEAGTNTVHCLVGRVYYFKWAGYKVRRLSSLG